MKKATESPRTSEIQQSHSTGNAFVEPFFHLASPDEHRCGSAGASPSQKLMPSSGHRIIVFGKVCQSRRQRMPIISFVAGDATRKIQLKIPRGGNSPVKV
jgi:hypothetical protein